MVFQQVRTFAIMGLMLLISACGSSETGDVTQDGVNSNTAGMGTYSVGWRVGDLVKFSKKGTINKSGEGQLMLGFDGAPWVITSEPDEDGYFTTVTKSPWAFSTTEAGISQVNPYRGQRVVIKYNQAKVKSLALDTDYEVLEIGPLSDDRPEACSVEAEGGESYSEGFRAGRIVKLSEKGSMTKSWEAQLQLGQAGGQYFEISLSDKAIFECALRFLKSGTQASFFYEESLFRNPTQRDTAYRLVRIVPKA